MTEQVLKLFHKDPLIVTEKGCWEWPRARNKPRGGYGQITTREPNYGKRHCYLTHRIAFELANGPIPEKMAVCHRCDNPPCCNPNHLFLGTKRDNWNDMFAKKRNPRGSKHHWSKLTEKVVLKIVERLPQASNSKIAKEFAISDTCVSNIRCGKTWADFTGRPRTKAANTGAK